MLEHNRASEFFIAGSGELACLAQFSEDFRFGASGQDVIAFVGQRFEYLDDVLGGLAGAEYDLWKAAANLTVMVYARETEILEGQVAEILDRLVDGDLAGLDLFKQLPYLFRLNGTPAFLSIASGFTPTAWLIRSIPLLSAPVSGLQRVRP